MNKHKSDRISQIPAKAHNQAGSQPHNPKAGQNSRNQYR